MNPGKPGAVLNSEVGGTSGQVRGLHRYHFKHGQVPEHEASVHLPIYDAEMGATLHDMARPGAQADLAEVR